MLTLTFLDYFQKKRKKNNLEYQSANISKREFYFFKTLILFWHVTGNNFLFTLSNKFLCVVSLTEAASCAIVKFLEIESSEANSNGWTLLSTINLLSVGDQALIDCMTAASLPSTLVKCLYLFFDLPNLPEDETVLEGCEFTMTERRILLQKIFVQVWTVFINILSPSSSLLPSQHLLSDMH